MMKLKKPISLEIEDGLRNLELEVVEEEIS